jgi:hypothetical protein
MRTRRPRRNAELAQQALLGRCWRLVDLYYLDAQARVLVDQLSEVIDEVVGHVADGPPIVTDDEVSVGVELVRRLML